MRAAAERHAFSYDKLTSMFATLHEEGNPRSNLDSPSPDYPRNQGRITEWREDNESANEENYVMQESPAWELTKRFMFSIFEAVLDIVI